MNGYCEDYPCCGHTFNDPCDGVTTSRPFTDDDWEV